VVEPIFFLFLKQKFYLSNKNLYIMNKSFQLIVFGAMIFFIALQSMHSFQHQSSEKAKVFTMGLSDVFSGSQHNINQDEDMALRKDVNELRLMLTDIKNEVDNIQSDLNDLQSKTSANDNEKMIKRLDEMESKLENISFDLYEKDDASNESLIGPLMNNMKQMESNITRMNDDLYHENNWEAVPAKDGLIGWVKTIDKKIEEANTNNNDE
jgi:tetrahydromethanopterin S-methyltransferase subunit G